MSDICNKDSVGYIMKQREAFGIIYERIGMTVGFKKCEIGNSFFPYISFKFDKF